MYPPCGAGGRREQTEEGSGKGRDLPPGGAPLPGTAGFPAEVSAPPSGFIHPFICQCICSFRHECQAHLPQSWAPSPNRGQQLLTGMPVGTGWLWMTLGKGPEWTSTQMPRVQGPIPAPGRPGPLCTGLGVLQQTPVCLGCEGHPLSPTPSTGSGPQDRWREGRSQCRMGHLSPFPPAATLT